MPVLPLPRLQPGQASLGRRASPEDFGAGVGQAGAQRAQIFGQVGQVAAEISDANDRIRTAANQAKLSRIAAQYGADLDRAALDLESDPDLDSHEQKIQKSSQDLLEKYRQELPAEMHSQLEARVFPDQAHARLSVVSFARTKRIDNSRADLVEMSRLSADKEAREGDPVRRAQIRGQRVGALDGALHSGILDQAGYDKLVRGSERQVSEADFLAVLEHDPAGAYKALASPNSPLAGGLSEAERLERRKSAQEAFEQQLAQRRALVGFSQGQEDRAKKQASDAAQKSADDLLYSGKIEELHQFIGQSREVLTPEQYRFYSDAVAQGGKGEVKTHEPLYVDLSRKAARGEPISDELQQGYLSKKITREDYDRLSKASEDRRFSSSREFLDHSFRQGMFDFDPVRQLKSAEAMKQFDDWMAKNPDAGPQDADKFARETLRAFGIRDVRNLMKPGDPAGKSGGADIGGIVAAATQKRASGQMTDDEYKAELRRARDLETAQQMTDQPK